ncbi:hypothetical protein [Saccharopolyspora sp. ASAGF58]|uniref:hypothetical protein n=1 Tax=Saccharopolyspora sp. ASAGF58 TaxID=2719023 RepID=UPI0014401343|nr:hypothetical protein [Saccharopolyspora sp. ASAGF58]QIZ35262.1 hypothetical protein FDZ84_11795 [Saccharopolyspora sp. ASAGF58]
MIGVSHPDTPTAVDNFRNFNGNSTAVELQAVRPVDPPRARPPAVRLRQKSPVETGNFAMADSTPDLGVGQVASR